ncbi:MAG TPA: hypothetical protein VK125_07495 [Bacillota bacterium]|nr:hypothetical protein [Bacillota bacterium]
MKQPLRYFSMGLLAASVVLIIIFIVISNMGSDKNKMTTDEMIDALTDDGYRVLTDSDYMTLALSGEQNDEEEDAKEENDEENKDDAAEENEESDEEASEDDSDSEEDSDEQTKKTEYTINIKENMLAPEISKVLKENKIINDADKFTKYLEDEGFSQYIQLGKHEVNNEMSERELAKALTNK